MLRVRDWQQYEVNRTRELRALRWVPVPNRLDGDAYTSLVDHPDGAAHFGAWIALLLVASRCDPRGTLSREGAGLPHDPATLSRLTRIRVEVFEAAIPRLLEIGLLENVNEDSKIDELPQYGAGIPQVAAAIPQQPATTSRDLALQRREEHRGEGNTRSGRVRALDVDPSETWKRAGFEDEDEFEEWFRRVHHGHANPKGRAAARTAFLDAIVDGTFDRATFEANYAVWRECPRWLEDAGRFVPNLAAYICDGMWLRQPAIEVDAW